MPESAFKDKDYSQAIKESYDPDLRRLRVEAILTDGIDALIVNPDGSLNVNLTGSGNVTVNFPTDQSLGTIESGIVDTAFSEINSVVAENLSTIVTYTATTTTRMKFVEVTGTNIAEYTIWLNGTAIHKKRTYFGNLDNTFQFSKGYSLVASDVIQVKVLHHQSGVGSFSAFVLCLKDM